jgi:glutaminyl-tRNA synthetase
MSSLPASTPTSNFIRTIIDADLASGRHSSIVTRFPPEPNGYLHVGHAKSICLNFGLALDYQGKCNLRFDDTNPEKESFEYAQSIQDDVRWLGFQWDGDVRWASDYFEQLYAFAVELINKGLAYVDDLTAEEMREYRGTLTRAGKNSPYRDRSVAENLDLFSRMRGGEFADGAKILRAKIDMASSATRQFTASAVPTTSAPMTTGASIRCMTTRIASQMRSKASRTPSARWSSRIIARSTTGCWTT